MARTEKLTLEYIQLDCVDKTTLKRLHRKFGNDGRLFWYELLRLLGRSENYILDLSDEWILEDVLESELYVGKEKGIDIINSLVKWGNIDEKTWVENRNVWCQSLIDRHENLFNKRKNFPVNPYLEVEISDAEMPITETEIKVLGNNRAEMTKKRDLGKINSINVAESTQSRVEESKDNNTYYQNESQFLKDWATVRKKMDGKETNIKKLTTIERVNFNLIRNYYTKKEFHESMKGMFQQHSMFPSTRLRPKHFLDEGNLEKYRDAFSNSTQLFTKKAGML